MWLNLIQIVIAILISCLILLQAKGSGLGINFGGQSQAYHSKRGVEKAIFITTIVLIGIFTLISIFNLSL